MKTIDLSHAITPRMPLYPGTPPPVFKTAHTIDKDGFAERDVTLSSHIGTHIDAPAHVIPRTATLDQMSINRFAGRALVIDLTGLRGSKIEPAKLEYDLALIKTCEFVLLHTGWSRYWGEQKYFEDYPVLTDEAALWLAGFHLKGVGVDMISVDEPGSTELFVHNTLLERGILIIENLAHLEQLPQSGFTFCCFPLKLEDAEASPVRAAALILN